MHALARLLHADDIQLGWAVANKVHLFDRVAQLVQQRYGIRAALVSGSLGRREAIGSTGLGHGVAIPHARVDGLPHPVGLFVRSRLALPFDAPDGKPVSLILVLLVPPDATTEHLQLLVASAVLFDDRAVRDRLHDAVDAAAVLRILATERTDA